MNQAPLPPGPAIQSAGDVAASLATRLRFPVRRDGWDAVDFYLLLGCGGMTAGTFLVALGIASWNKPGPGMSGWFPLAIGLCCFLQGAVTAVLQIWARFAQVYELTDTELIVHFGYRAQRVPYAEVARVHPVKICRTTTALKPAMRIVFRRSIVNERHVDVSPENPDGFLEELAARCPHLEREGPRMQLRPESNSQQQL